MSEQNALAEESKFFTCECGGKVSVNALQCPHCGDPEAVNKAYMRGDIVKPKPKTEAKPKTETKPAIAAKQKTPSVFKGVIRWFVVFPGVLFFALVLLSVVSDEARTSGAGVVVVLSVILFALYWMFWEMGKKPYSSEKDNKQRNIVFAITAAIFFAIIGSSLSPARELTPEQIAQKEERAEKRKEERAERERVAAAEAKEEERKKAAQKKEQERKEAARKKEEERKARVKAMFQDLGYARITGGRRIFRIKTFTFMPEASPQDIMAHGRKETARQSGVIQLFYYPKGTSSIPHYELSAAQDRGIDAVHRIIRYSGAKWHYVFMQSANGNKTLFDCVKYPEGDPAGVLCPGQL